MLHRGGVSVDERSGAEGKGRKGERREEVDRVQSQSS